MPGTVLLELALELVLARLPGMTLAELARVKFTVPVQPGQEIEVRYGPMAHARVDFVCLCEGAVAVRGTALLKRLL